MVTVMMQSTGRVLDANYVLSAALRASPVVCALDTAMMIAEFICLLHVGCSITTAARHVWYGRFEHGSTHSIFNLPLASIEDDKQSSSVLNNREVLANAHLVAAPAPTSNSPESVAVAQPATDSTDGNLPGGTETPNEISHQDATTVLTGRGTAEASSRPTTPSRDLETMANSNYLAGSSIDHNWRQSMFAFTIGAAPQALKVFAMRGIPITQVVTSIYVIAFLVPEFFRLTAGSAGEVELRPMPTVVRTKERVDRVVGVLHRVATMISFLLLHAWFIEFLHDHYSHVAIQVFLLLVPTWLMCQVLIRIWAWFSVAPALGPSFAFARQLWAAHFQVIHHKVLQIIEEITVDGTYILPGFAMLWVLLSIVSCTLIIGATSLPEVWSGSRSLQTVPTRSMQLTLFGISAYGTFPLISLLFYNVLFVGSLSKTPRRLTGIKGSKGELVAGYVTLSSLITAFYIYGHFWTSEGTYKPAWADYLG